MLAAEVESDRSAQPGKLVITDARSPQAFASIALRLSAADRADVATAASERLDDRRLVELDVVVVTATAVGPEVDLVGDFVRPADDQPVDEPGGNRSGVANDLAAIDDDGLVAELAGQPDERPGHLYGPDDDEPRPRLGNASTNTDRPSISTVRDVPRRSASRAAVTSASSAESEPQGPVR